MYKHAPAMIFSSITEFGILISLPASAQPIFLLTIGSPSYILTLPANCTCVFPKIPFSASSLRPPFSTTGSCTCSGITMRCPTSLFSKKSIKFSSGIWFLIM
ncbi:hypothetical protein Hanom_Chr10g00923181 [Helianthus anomalus]